MRDAGHWTPDAEHRTAEKAKIIYPPPRGVDIITLNVIVFKLQLIYSTVRTSKELLLSYAMSYMSEILLCYS